MAAALKTVLGGLAAAATGLIVFSGHGGVFAAEVSRPVSVALASGKVSTAAERIAAMSASLAETAATNAESSGLPDGKRQQLATAMVSSPESGSDTSASEDRGLSAAAPVTAPLAALVPTPQSKPEVTGSTQRRMAVPLPSVARDAATPRRASAARTRSVRAIRVVDEEPNERPARRLLTFPLPPIIGAYR